MSIRYKLKFKTFSDGKNMLILLIGSEFGIDPESMPAGLIGNVADSKRESALLNFIDSIIEGTNKYDDYWTEGYTAQVVNKDGKKMLKIFFNLTNDYKPGYFYPEDIRELLVIWMREREKFDKNPEEYKGEMIKKGALVLNLPELRNPAVYEKKLSEAKYGVIEDWREAKSDKLDMLPREFSDKGKADESNRPWWQFWK